MSGLRLFHATNGGMTQVVPRLAEVESDVQHLVEAHMETMLGVRFLASEYSTGPVHGGRIDSVGIDENGSPVIVEYKRGTDPGVINQGLFYLAWLVDHKEEFRRLVRDRLGAAVAAHVLWSEPRLVCVAGDFTRYDMHAVREHRRSIDLVRYRFFGKDLVGLETVASFSARTSAPKRVRRGAAPHPPVKVGSMRWHQRPTKFCSASATASPESSASSTAPTSACGTSHASARRRRPSSSSTSGRTRAQSTSSPGSLGM